MRKKVISGVICALMIAAILVIEIPKDVSAQVREEWVKRYQGIDNSSDSVYDMVIDSSGNVIVCGYTWGGYPWLGGTDRDYVTIKYDTNGNELWIAQYNGPDNHSDSANAIAIDSSGNSYVTGKITMDSWNSSSAFGTIAYDTNGNILWTNQHLGIGIGHNSARDIALDSLGNVYVTGASNGIYDDLDKYDYLTVAYDPNGNQLWDARYNGSFMDDVPTALAISPSGNIYITGRSYGGGYDDFATVAYDSNGNELWVARYNGPGNGKDIPIDIAIDFQGNVYVTGCSKGSGTGLDYTTIAYDSDGNELWIARYNGPGNDEDSGNAIACGPSGNIYVTGSSIGIGADYDYATVAYDCNGNELWITRYNGPGDFWDWGRAIALDFSENIYVTGSSCGNGTGWDYGTISYDYEGNELWVVRYDGPGDGSGGFPLYNLWWVKDGDDYPIAIVVDSLRNVYVTGNSILEDTRSDFATVKYSTESTDQCPTADAGPDQIVNEGDVVEFNGLASYDSDGTIETYEWDFDANDGLWWETGAAIDATGPIATHIYGDDGKFTVTLRVIDNDGASDMDTCIATILLKVPSVAIDIDPNTLNLKSKGKRNTCHITLNNPYDVNDIDISTILLEDTIPSEWGDIQDDTLTVKFDRSDVEDMLPPGTYNLKVTGELTDGTSFEGYSDEIRVIDPP